MAERGSYVVLDAGKTLTKVTLWSRSGCLLDRQVRPNVPTEVDGLRRLDLGGIGAWVEQALSRYAGHPIEALVPVGHGAGVVALGADGPLFAPLDYEQPIPANVLASYRAARDPFAVTGSPALPDGLNLGSQLFWLERLYPGAFTSATLVPWAQYWAWFLSGSAVSEVTSLGCHSDLWNPAGGRFSPLAERSGWADRFAPLAPAGKAIGTLRSELALATGLPGDARVLAGVHDSNAALLAARGFSELADNEATILSTGTWFIAMHLAREPVSAADLPPDRDTLVNVDVEGLPVPSARFMGGREIESVIEFDTRRVDIKPDQPALLAAVPTLLERGTKLLPTLAPGCGPFPAGAPEWLNLPPNWDDDHHLRRAAVCLYAALVADAALDLIGAKERLLIEGRFAEAEVFVRALAALRPRTQVFTANAHNDVSFGALRLIDPDLAPQGELVGVEPLPGNLAAYRADWHNKLAVPA